MEQLLIHILGDYCLQSSEMALNKKKKTLPCLIHCIIYTLCFLFLTTNWKILLVIFSTHFLMDRFNWLTKLIWVREQVLSYNWNYPYKFCKLTGYYDFEVLNVEDSNRRPLFITVWLYIIHDNFFHLVCNWAAFKYLS